MGSWARLWGVGTGLVGQAREIGLDQREGLGHVGGIRPEKGLNLFRAVSVRAWPNRSCHVVPPDGPYSQAQPNLSFMPCRPNPPYDVLCLDHTSINWASAQPEKSTVQLRGLAYNRKPMILRFLGCMAKLSLPGTVVREGS